MNLQNQLDWLPSLLDGVVVPAAINVNVLKSEIMLQCGLLTPIYSEPELMKQAIAQWFAARTWTFEHLIKIIQAQYSPIENTEVFDSTERTISESEMTSESMTGNSSDMRHRSAESSGDTSRDANRDRQRSASETADNENTVSAFNASTYQPQNSGNDSSMQSESEYYADSESTNYADSSSGSESGSETHDNEMERAHGRDYVEKFVQHKHGNIGTMTNFQLIEGELELLHNFNIYKWIALNFRAELFIEVY